MTIKEKLLEGNTFRQEKQKNGKIKMLDIFPAIIQGTRTTHRVLEKY